MTAPVPNRQSPITTVKSSVSVGSFVVDPNFLQAQTIKGASASMISCVLG